MAILFLLNLQIFRENCFMHIWW